MLAKIRPFLTIALVICVCSATNACSKATPTPSDPVSKNFDADRTYQFSIFGTEESCQEFRKENPIANCYQSATFAKDGNAFVLLSDMGNNGSYVIEEHSIRVDFSIAADAPATMVFILSDDEKTITNQTDGKQWVLFETTAK